MAVVSLLWALGAISFSTFTCRPVSSYWDKSSHDGYCLKRRLYKNGNIVIAVIGMLTDIVILIIPMPALWKSQMRRKQKNCYDGSFGYWSIVSLDRIFARVEQTDNGNSVCIFSLLRVVQFFCFDLEHLSSEYIDHGFHHIMKPSNNSRQLRAA